MQCLIKPHSLIWSLVSNPKVLSFAWGHAAFFHAYSILHEDTRKPMLCITLYQLSTDLLDSFINHK